MFNLMDIFEYVYEGVVEPSTEILIKSSSNHDGCIREFRGIDAFKKNRMG